MSHSDLTPDTTLSKKLKYIVITHGDSYLGQTLAMHIADQLDKGQGQLKKKHRAEVDYESQHTITEQLKVHIKTMVYNPFAATMGRMVECGINVLDAAIRQDVKRIVMAHLRHHYKYGSWVVYRIPFIQQYMYFWTQMLENNNMLGMPISESDMLLTVNIKDVQECVAIASLSKKSMVIQQPAVAIKRVYELISEPLTLAMMADAMSRALREAGGSFGVNAAVLTDEQLETYLKLVAKTKQSGAAAVDIDAWTRNILDTAKILEPAASSSYQQGVSELLQSRSFLASTTNRDHQDSPDLYPCPADTLTPFCIQLIMNHFRVARNMPVSPPMLPSSNDIRDIIGRAPIPIDVFFMMNRKLFHPQ
ncbi:hypothetical protein FB192DRAFT_1329414 [Mucor lusitanicus]|uniref:Uncharacterized protein n=1 Tax=Mucor circinelloides f. lusitanicus TaxID=29924 RepID=A0A8H4EYI2_MUCCL|nr:hypothetical protein FB192DRAFT_1329414 [Mucor lusitanicus]